MHIVFYSTSDVFRAEEELQKQNIDCTIVPTPVTDRAYCGVCVQVKDIDVRKYLRDMEYEIVE